MFAKRGYEAVTVNEIAEAAGVAKVTLFTYFPTKESLVLDVVKDSFVSGVQLSLRVVAAIALIGLIIAIRGVHPKATAPEPAKPEPADGTAPEPAAA